ncbi:hypothetical protein EYC84_006992 [Monilinia fructicola]|uniref:Uncharacterized protein n=1 Tax=Monilinia fructicola TaxID=38448 RepID=A0A5M9KDD2_MONFR|nr:hypothetical protein EYC84_006992 [Monilinia fructicola]
MNSICVSPVSYSSFISYCHSKTYSTFLKTISPSRYLCTINTCTTNTQSSCGYYTPCKCGDFPILISILIAFWGSSNCTEFWGICSILLRLGGSPRTTSTTEWGGGIGPTWWLVGVYFKLE